MFEIIQFSLLRNTTLPIFMNNESTHIKNQEILMKLNTKFEASCI